MALELEKNIFDDLEFQLFDLTKGPRHVAIIMDGNRRWERQTSGKAEGHNAGAQTLLTIVNAAIELGIQTLTVFGFSTENWSRSRTEVTLLLKLFHFYLSNYREKMKEKGIAFHVIGDLTAFPTSLVNEIRKTQEWTKEGKKINFVVALNYGGRDELVRTLSSIVNDIEKGHVKKENVSESLVASYLDTAPFGDPDLLIRTSGEMRLSNFLLWQLAYTEIFVTEKFWPEFTPQELLRASLSYQSRKRRFGR